MPVVHVPPDNTVQAWAFDYVGASALDAKCSPAPVPDAWEKNAPVRRLTGPARPVELEVTERSRRSMRPRELQHPEKRARLLHTFWHHELQAAELMAWAVLAFPDTPESFRRGLIGIARDEIRHMAMYQRRIEALGFEIGSFPVRDWFWERVPTCETPTQFVALLGLGLEGGNLDHSERFIRIFEECDDPQASAVQAVVCREEVAHVKFAAHWFSHWTGQEVDFDLWRAELVPPLTPSMFRGRPTNREARLSAGLSSEFVDALEAWKDPA